MIMKQKYRVGLTDNFYKKYDNKIDVHSLKEKNNIKKYLEESINFDTIDALQEMDRLFPTERFDIFISHSHNDINKARILKKYLESNFGLKVFVDSEYWESSDEYLYELDKKFCKKTDGHFSYEKRNYTTSHVHIMLAISIINALNKSTVVLFLQTENFSQNYNEFEFQKISSPWIYLEAYMTKLFSEITRNLNHFVGDSAFKLIESSLPKINYEVKINNLKTIDDKSLEKWYQAYLVETYKNSSARKKTPVELLDLILGESK